MAISPPRPCAHPGCNVLIHSGSRCPPHKAANEARKAAIKQDIDKRYNQARPATDNFYKTPQWARFRVQYLRSHPLCVECERNGRITPAKIVDHIQPLKTHPELGLDPANMRGLCSICHNRVGKKVRKGEGRSKV